MLGKIYVDVAVRGTCRKVHFEINPKDLNPAKAQNQKKNDQRLRPWAGKGTAANLYLSAEESLIVFLEYYSTSIQKGDCEVVSVQTFPPKI